MDVTAHNQETGLPIEGPGRLLREAREALNLGQDEVARRLHIDLKMVRALESDDYKKLPPPIFVIGYLRNYARLANLPADELIASFNRAAGAQPPPIKVMTPSKQGGAEHRSDRPVQLTTYVMALAVLVLVLGLWWWQGRDEPEAVGDVPVSIGTGADGVTLPLQPPGGISTELIPVPIPGVSDVPSGATTTPAPMLAPTPPTLEVPVPLPGAVPGLNQSRPLAPSMNSAVPPVSPAPAIVAAPAVIKLTFEADSWVQIIDANQQRVFYDLGKEGTSRTLQGVPPLQVVIGYSPGVKIEYNGVPFDQSRFERGDRASFVLGKAVGAN